MPSTCKTKGCMVTASYGVTSRVACAAHKTPDMENLAVNTKCRHGKRRSRCADCGGSEMCFHKRYRAQCVECDGASICFHGRRRNMCVECDGASICRHERRRSMCVECGGANICADHGKRKAECLECGGSALCQCGNHKNPRYDGWCADCFHRLYPDDPRSKNTNDAELRLEQHLEAHAQVRRVNKTSIDCEGRSLIPDAIVEIEGGGTVMIELDGPQHFAVFPFFHDNGEDDLQDQIARDCAKNRYAREHGWSLLRISYKEYKSLEQIVDQFISDFVEGERKQLFRATNAQLYNSIKR